MLPDQKRLQVVNSVNPSLRQAATPADFLQGGNVNLQSNYNVQPTYNPQQTVDYTRPNQYANPNIGVSVAPPQNLQFNGQTYGPSLNLSTSVTPEPSQPKGLLGFGTALFDAGKSLVGGGINAAETPYYAGRSLIDRHIFGNELQAQNDQDQASQDFQTGVGLVRGVPRQIVQLGESLNPFGGDVYKRQVTPTGGFQKFVLGDQPISSLQQTYKQTAAEKGSAYAKGETGVNVLMDALLLKGGYEGAKRLTPNNELSTSEARSLARTSDPEAIQTRLANKLDVSPESVDNLSQQIANTSSAKAVHSLVNDHVTALRETAAAEAVLAGAISEAQTPQQVQTILEQHYPQIGQVLSPESEAGLVDTLTKTNTPEEAKGVLDKLDQTIASRNTTPSAPPEVNAQIDPELVRQGLTSSQIAPVPTSSLKLGIDSVSDGLDPAQVQKVIDDIKAGKPINPLITTTENGQTFVQDGAHRLEALKQLGIENAPTVEKGTGVPQEQLAKEAIAAQSLRNEATPKATEASASSVENKPTGVAEQTNANADKGLTAKEVKELRKAGYDEATIQQLHQGAGGDQLPTETQPTPQDTSNFRDLVSKENKRTKLMSLEYRANKLGETGQELVSAVAQKNLDSARFEQQLLDQAKPFLDLPEEDQALAVDVREGKATTDNPAIQQAVQALDNFYKNAHETATVNGLEVGNRGDTYFNHTYPEGYFDKPENLNAAIKHLVDTGQATDTTEAAKMMTQFKQTGNFGGSEFGNFKTRTADVPGYLKNGQAVRQYAHGAAERVSDVANFGKNGENLNALIGKAVERGEDAGALRDIIDAYRNPKATKAGMAGKVLSDYQKVLNVLQLPKAAVSHVTQLFTNTGSDIGFANTFKALGDRVLSGEDNQFLHDAGLKLDSNEGSGIANKVTSPGIKQLVQFYREVSGIGGKNIAEGLASKGDVEGLGKLGVKGDFETNPDGSINLTDNQKYQAAHYVADKNIGRNDPFQSPAWTQGDLGKFVSQYKRAYVFKQGERIINMFNEAKTGNVAPLAKYLLVAPVAGAAITVAKNELKAPGSNPAKTAGGFALDSLRNSGITSLGFGYPQNAIDAARYNFNTDSRFQNAAGAIAPGLGFAVQTGQGIDKAVRGKPGPLERQGLKLIPVGGNALADKFAPSTYTDTSKSQTINGVNVPAGLKVNIPKGASQLETQALVDKAQEQQDTKSMTGSFSKEDQALINLSDTDLKRYLKNNTIDQSKYDQILSEKQAVNNVTPNSASDTGDPLADAYYDKQAKLTKTGKSNYLNAPPDDTAKAITNGLNKTLPPGLQPVQASNKVADLYASYKKAESDAAAKGEPWDEFEQHDKARTFWKSVATQQASEQAQDIYKQSITQLKDYFMKNNKVNRQDLTNAVALDDALYNANLIDTLHFSKSFRTAFGFGLPAGPGGSGVSSSGSGGRRGGFSSSNPNSPNYNGYSSGLNQLIPPNLSLKQPTVNTVPSFGPVQQNIPKVNYFKPSDVTGLPRPARATPIRVKRYTVN